MKYSRFPYYGAIIFAFLMPALAISQYTAQSSMVKFYDANERFFAAVLAEDVTTLDQLLADDISFGLFNEKIKTKEAYLSAVKQQLLFCDAITYTVSSVDDFYKNCAINGKVDITYRHQLADSTWKESVEYLSYTAKYTKKDNEVRMVSFETIHHDTGLETHKQKD